MFNCKNGGSCINNNGVGFCKCEWGYNGTYCENEDEPIKITTIGTSDKVVQNIIIDQKCDQISCIVSIKLIIFIDSNFSILLFKVP